MQRVQKHNSKARFLNHTLYVYNIHVKYLFLHVALYFAWIPEAEPITLRFPWIYLLGEIPLTFNYPINTVINPRSRRKITSRDLAFERTLYCPVAARNSRIVTSLGGGRRYREIAMLIGTQVDIYAGFRISLNCSTESPIKMSLHDFIRFYLVAGQRILRRSSRIIVAIPSLSIRGFSIHRFAPNFNTS